MCGVDIYDKPARTTQQEPSAAAGRVDQKLPAMMIGGYEVTRISRYGAQVGCHRVSRSEVEELLRQMRLDD